MIRTMIGVALVTLLFAGPAALDASAQATSTQPSATATPAKTPAKSHMAAKKKAEPEASATAVGLAYPPCSRTVKDQCIQLWQRNLSTVYPQCAKIKSTVSRAACIEDAYKQQKS